MADAQNFISYKDQVKLNPREEEVRRRDSESRTKIVAPGPYSKNHIHVRQGELTFLDQNGFAFSQMSGIEEDRAKNAVPYGVADTSLAPGKNTKITVTIDGPVEVEVNGQDEMKQGEEVYAYLTMSNQRIPEYRPAANRAPSEILPILTTKPEKYAASGKPLALAITAILTASRRGLQDGRAAALVEQISAAVTGAQAEGVPEADRDKLLATLVSLCRQISQMPKITKEGFRMFKVGRVMKGAKPGQRAGINFKVE